MLARMTQAQAHKLFITAAVRFRRLAREFAEAEKELAEAETVYFGDDQTTQSKRTPQTPHAKPAAS
jgi:negative regulator of replication initiation